MSEKKTFTLPSQGITVKAVPGEPYPEMRIKAPGGEFVVWVGHAEAVQAGIMFCPDNSDGTPFDLALCEIKNDELAGKENNQDIDIYVYSNPLDEDFTGKETIKEQKIDAFRNEVNKDHDAGGQNDVTRKAFEKFVNMIKANISDFTINPLKDMCCVRITENDFLLCLIAVAYDEKRGRVVYHIIDHTYDMTHDGRDRYVWVDDINEAADMTAGILKTYKKKGHCRKYIAHRIENRVIRLARKHGFDAYISISDRASITIFEGSQHICMIDIFSGMLDEEWFNLSIDEYAKTDKSNVITNDEDVLLAKVKEVLKNYENNKKEM